MYTLTLQHFDTAVKSLFPTLKEKDSIVRPNAVIALEEVGKLAVEALIVNILD